MCDTKQQMTPEESLSYSYFQGNPIRLTDKVLTWTLSLVEHCYKCSLFQSEPNNHLYRKNGPQAIVHQILGQRLSFNSVKKTFSKIYAYKI